MPKDKGYRKNLGCPQPGIEYGPDDNGWPDPLASTANPIKHSYVDGKSGSVESKPVESVKITR